ncbi:hypothetical protein [Vagococcus bubulae]|uniref:Uncharacterized protein n=1 Tax=Vagococcus bubulae TaxID=1977868 RepID=A0A429ZM96_9ENTE|nr:hypothetical protein [Vagococcus bubulae]RST94827.1 hypothetical protein CBF36_04675 [Vagococcus bubulae]
MAYDIGNFNKLGALYKLVDGINGDDFTSEDVKRMEEIIDEAINSTVDKSNALSFRYQTKEAIEEGRVAINKVRKAMVEQWNL